MNGFEKYQNKNEKGMLTVQTLAGSERNLDACDCLQSDSINDRASRERASPLPRTISFKGAMQTLEAFQPIVALRAKQAAARASLYNKLVLLPETNGKETFAFDVR